MKFLQSLLQFIPAIPQMVQAIEFIHKDSKDGASKKQLAMESLGLAGGVASALLPTDQTLITGITDIVGRLIDHQVTEYNQTGWPENGAQTLPTVPSSTQSSGSAGA